MGNSDVVQLRGKVCTIADRDDGGRPRSARQIARYEAAGKLGRCLGTQRAKLRCVYPNHPVRSVLDPLVDMAAELNVAIMGVMHFNKKRDVTNVMLRTSDSLAFTAIARQVYGAIDDQENGRKLFVKGKNNIADRAYSDKTLAYRLASKKVGTDEETGEDIIAPFIVWDDDHVDITADEAMSATKSAPAIDEAKGFLASVLADGPVLATQIKEAATANGVSGSTLKRAKQELGLPTIFPGCIYQVPAARLRCYGGRFSLTR